MRSEGQAAAEMPQCSARQGLTTPPEDKGGPCLTFVTMVTGGVVFSCQFQHRTVSNST